MLVSALLLLILVSAAPASAAECRTIPPAETDPAIGKWPEPHYVCINRDVPSASRLLLFFPGTGARPEQYRLLTEEAADGGLHAINLRYGNPYSINFQVCGRRNRDPDCHEKARREILDGTDRHPLIEVDRPNSIENRFPKLLSYLADGHPDEGWSQYLGSDGKPVWSQVVVAGHSQGGGHATLIAKDHLVARVVIFSWLDAGMGSLAPWITGGPHATKKENYYAFEHLDDRIPLRARRRVRRALGLDAFGAEVSVDDRAPPYENSHMLITHVEPASDKGSPEHNCIAADEWTPKGANGRPVFAAVWRHLFGAAPPSGDAPVD